MATRRRITRILSPRRGSGKVFFLVAFTFFFLGFSLLFLFQLQGERRRPPPVPPPLPAADLGTALRAVKVLLFDAGLSSRDAVPAPAHLGAAIAVTVERDFDLARLAARLSSQLEDLGWLPAAAGGAAGEGEALRFSPSPGDPGEALTLLILRRPPKKAPVAASTPPRPRVAIVLDDIGERLDLAQRVAKLPAPVTLSIFPRQGVSERAARFAARQSKEIIMHLPMEPLEYPEKDPGPGALLGGMSQRDLVSTVREDLKTVPGAAGLNNHMGSRLTADEQAMGDLMRFLAANRLFFLDSRTTPESVAYRTARERGVRSAQRDVFLDNIDEPAAIRAQLDSLLEVARLQGEAVGIGHPRENTLAALDAWLPTLRKAGVDVVPLSKVVR